MSGARLSLPLLRLSFLNSLISVFRHIDKSYSLLTCYTMILGGLPNHEIPVQSADQAACANLELLLPVSYSRRFPPCSITSRPFATLLNRPVG
jgi:hypothetical protein